MASFAGDPPKSEPPFADLVASLFPQDTPEQAAARMALLALAEEYADRTPERPFGGPYPNIHDDPRMQDALRTVLGLGTDPPAENVLLALAESLK